MAKSKTTFRKITSNILIQILPVMIGVYLGFALNNFGESRKTKRQKETFRTMLYNEILSNLEGVDKGLPYHLQLQSDFDSLLVAPSVFTAFEDYTLRGIRLSRFSDGAYNTGVQTGIFSEFDLNFVQIINNLYTLQASKRDINNTILSTFIAKDQPESDEESVALLQSMQIGLNDIVAGGYDLRNFYCEVLRGFFSEKEEDFAKFCESVQRY